MNFEQIHRQLTSVLPYLTISFNEYKQKEKSYYYAFYDVQEFKEAYKTVLRYVPFIVDETTMEWVKPINDLDSNYNVLTLDKKSGDNFKYGVDSVREAVERFIEYIENNLLEDSKPNSLFVKFPEIKDLDELEKITKELRLALNVPIYHLGGQVELSAIDSGSFIFEFALSVAVAIPALSMIADFARKAIEVKKEYHQSQIIAAQARKLGAEADVVETLRKQIDAKYELNRENDAKRIINDYGIEENPDNINTFKGSLEAFISLTNKDAEFSASIKAPDEVQKKFPSPQEMKQLKEATKLLDKTGEENNPNETSDEV